MVNQDAAFLQEVMERNGVTVKQLTQKLGINDHSNHVHKYLNGRSTIPREVYTALIEMTGDMELVTLVFGSGGFFMVPRPKENLAGDSVMLRHLLEMRKSTLYEESAVLDILADGKINDGDFKAMKKYRQVHPEAIKLQVQLFEAINETFEKAREKGTTN